MDKSVDLERAKLIAEQIVELKNNLSDLNKELKELFKDTNVPVKEILSSGGQLIYEIIKPKPKFDYVTYSAFLYQSLKHGKTLSEEELDDLLPQFTIEKNERWSLKVKK
ncbi:hypothetical protein [Mycoplasmopsis anatis]|uniref:hypothetical protein n=1 Tax=Mycoplasmopsis anatis TaxID=171279 RepID=UPI001C4F6FD0|nr:hypothetical protein [Mycoplasmopsis anatis]MBW0596783.1 hypothetical protein [Mycoplasmopsis anatis]